MNIGRMIFAVFILIFLTCELSNAKMYKYVDENGVVNYQDYPPENVAPNTAIKEFSTVKSKAEDIDLSPKNNISEKTDESENITPAQKKKTIPEKTNYSNAQVELYVTSWCKYCKKAANYFRSKGVSFTEYDIEKDKVAARRKDRLSPKKGVPFAIVNGRKIYGFAPKAYENALKNL